MPYPRRGYHRRSSRYGARPYKRRYSGARIPGASRRKLRAVANLRTGGQIGIESKYFDCQELQALSNATATSLIQMDSVTPAEASIQYLNNPGVGSLSTNRDGRVIRNKSIEVNVTLEVITTSELIANLHNPTCCVALVLDTQVNATAPTAATYGGLVYSTLAAGPAIGQPYRNMDNTTRFRVLAFKRVQFNQQFWPDASSAANSASGNQQITFKMFRKLGFKTNFKTGGTATPAAANIVDNGIFLLAWADEVANSPVTLTATSRLRFTG